MFDIDDALLTKIGYNIAIMTEKQKDECKREIQEELNQTTRRARTTKQCVRRWTATKKR